MQTGSHQAKIAVQAAGTKRRRAERTATTDHHSPSLDLCRGRPPWESASEERRVHTWRTRYRKNGEKLHQRQGWIVFTPAFIPWCQGTESNTTLVNRKAGQLLIGIASAQLSDTKAPRRSRGGLFYEQGDSIPGFTRLLNTIKDQSTSPSMFNYLVVLHSLKHSQ